MRVKLLQTADSGGGKTSAVAGLVNAGYNLRIYDFDLNTRIIRKWLTSPDLWDKHVGIMSFNIMDDVVDGIGKKSAVPGKLRDGLERAFIDQNGKDLGKMTDWDDKTVAVIDTTTVMGKMFMRDSLLRYRGPAAPKGYAPDAVGFDQSVYGAAQQKFEAVINHLCFNDNIKCNVIFNAHLKWLEGDNGLTKCYPDTGCGSALSFSLGKAFTDIWRIDTKNDGSKFYRIEGDNKMSLKNSFPFKTGNEFEFDLGKAFNKLLEKE